MTCPHGKTEDTGCACCERVAELERERDAAAVANCPALCIEFCNAFQVHKLAAELESMLAACGPGGTLYASVEQILDKHSAWIARPSADVTRDVALAAGCAAHVEATPNFVRDSAIIAELEAKLARISAAMIVFLDDHMWEWQAFNAEITHRCLGNSCGVSKGTTHSPSCEVMALRAVIDAAMRAEL